MSSKGKKGRRDHAARSTQGKDGRKRASIKERQNE
jgi:hypothetical protein